MPRPSQIDEKRKELLPVVTRAFAELGYRRTTTAELAARCGVRENILYRLWPDKKAMFIAAIEHVYDRCADTWQSVEKAEARASSACNISGNPKPSAPIRRKPRPDNAAERLLKYEAVHGGEAGLYRIVFAGLSETDDPEIRSALSKMYRRFQRFIRRRVEAYRGEGEPTRVPGMEISAWAMIGLGTVVNIGRELGLMGDGHRRKLMVEAGSVLLEGRAR